MEMKVEKCLARIGWQGSVRQDETCLGELVRRFRYSVPYETLDLWRRREFSLELPEIYDKIVNRHRGGYCFELNGLFAWLLRELGFEVREYFGRWLLGEDERIPMRRHRVVCVRLPSGPDRVVDAGIGLAFMFSPLSLVFDRHQMRDGRTYRIVRDAEQSCVVEFAAQTGWVRLFSFDEAPQLPYDFDYAHWWCRTHPDSSFLKRVWVYLPTPDGGSKAVSLEKNETSGASELQFVVWDPRNQCERRSLEDGAELAEVLNAHFGIVEG